MASRWSRMQMSSTILKATKKIAPISKRQMLLAASCKGRMKVPALWTLMLCTRVSGSAKHAMDTASRCGRMARDTKVNGRMTKLMARGNYFTPTETFTKVIGSTIRRMASAPTLMLMGPSTWVTGKTISKMAMVMRRGLMALFTKASTKMERSMVLAS